MGKKITLIFLFVALLPVMGLAQKPRYIPKKFVNYFDTTEFKISYDDNKKWIRTYILTPFDVWDVDDDNTTHVRGSHLCLINIEGPGTKAGPKNGIFTTYLIDSADHSKRYRVYEQEFSNDKLNGVWRVFNLKGTCVFMQTFKNDSLNGISRTYWIDGKSIMEEKEYFNGRNKYIERNYAEPGKLKNELSFENGVINGLCKDYYPDGSLKSEAFIENEIMNGIFKYYYPGGKLWLEEIFKEGKDWTIIGNYDQNGKPREKGTLKDGNGTIYLYNDDGTLREIATYINGVEKK